MLYVLDCSCTCISKFAPTTQLATTAGFISPGCIPVRVRLFGVLCVVRLHLGDDFARVSPVHLVGTLSLAEHLECVLGITAGHEHTYKLVVVQDHEKDHTARFYLIVLA